MLSRGGLCRWFASMCLNWIRKLRGIGTLLCTVFRNIMKIVHLKSFSIHLFLWQLRHLRQVWWYFSTFFRHSVNSLGFWIPHRLRSSNFVRKQQEKRQTIFNFRTLCKLPSINLTLGSIPIQKSANGSGINTEFFCLQYPKRWIGWHETQHGDFGLAQSLEEGRGRNLAGLRWHHSQ